MQLLRFPHPLTVALLLVTSSLSQVLFPAFGNPLISPSSSRAHTASENLARELTFINFDEGSRISSECTGGPKAIPVEFDRRAVSIGRTTIPKSTPHTPSPQSRIMNWTASYLLISAKPELPCIVYASANTIADVRHKNAHSKYLGQHYGCLRRQYEYDLPARRMEGKNICGSIYVSSSDGLSFPKSRRT